MFRAEFFPAQQGDAIWIEYGKRGSVHRVLIDAGTPATAPFVRRRLESLAPDDRRFDLLVVTHVDTDHIGGVLKLLADLPQGVTFDDVWFNGWPQIRNARSSRLGPIDGELLSVALEKRGWPWNRHFGGSAIVLPETGPPPERKLRGGMSLTVLSPGSTQLAKLRSEWKDVVQDAGLDPKDKDRWKKLLTAAARKGVKSSILGTPDIKTLARSKFDADTAVANGSTIGLLAEFGGASALFSGDAHAPVLVDSVARLCRARRKKRLDVDLFKLPHHGSSGNVSNELLALVDARRFVFSTSGAVFGHPDDEAVARVIAAPTAARKTMHFNYTAATIAANYKKRKRRDQPDWRRVTLKRQYDYDAVFPQRDQDGIVLDL